MKSELGREMDDAAFESFLLGVSIVICYSLLLKKHIKNAYRHGKMTGWNNYKKNEIELESHERESNSI